MPIQLLTPDIVKKDGRAQEEERQRRLADLSREEERLIHSVNELRTVEKEEQQRKLDREISDEGTLGVRKSVLLAEVEMLEDRKRAAQQPVDDRAKELAERERDLQQQKTILESKVLQVQEEKEELRDYAERVKDKEHLIDERIAGLDHRELRIAGAEEQVRKSTVELSDKWVSYHTTVSKANELIHKREAQVEAGIKANAVRQAQLDLREQQLEARNRQITDRYQTLISAEKELL